MLIAATSQSVFPSDSKIIRIDDNKTRAANETIVSSNSVKSASTTFRWFPSYRSMTAGMLCLCFARYNQFSRVNQLAFFSVHMMNSNMGMAMVCMVDDQPKNSVSVAHSAPHRTTTSHSSNISRIRKSFFENTTIFTTSTTTSNPHPRPIATQHLNASDTQLLHFASTSQCVPKVNWSSEDQGWIFGAFNAGLLCMLLTGFMADKFNAKWMIIASVILASAANIMIPLTATWKFVCFFQFVS